MLTDEQRAVMSAIAKMGGIARAKSLTKARRKEIARQAGKAPKKKRKQ